MHVRQWWGFFFFTVFLWSSIIKIGNFTLNLIFWSWAHGFTHNVHSFTGGIYVYTYLLFSFLCYSILEARHIDQVIITSIFMRFKIWNYVISIGSNNILKTEGIWIKTQTWSWRFDWISQTKQLIICHKMHLGLSLKMTQYWSFVWHQRVVSWLGRPFFA